METPPDVAATAKPVDPPQVIYTRCCALAQINAGDLTPQATLNKTMSDLTANGYRAAFIITRECEPNLVDKLKAMGFTEVHRFYRRRDYEQQTMLTMWIKNL